MLYNCYLCYLLFIYLICLAEKLRNKEQEYKEIITLIKLELLIDISKGLSDLKQNGAQE